MFRVKPSFLNFLFIRNSTFRNISIGVGISWVVIFLYDLLSGELFSVKEMINYLLFGMVLVGAGLFSARKEYAELVSVYETGIETSGVIVDMFVKWWGGYVTYEYPYMDKKIRSTERLNRTWKTKPLQTGQKVWLYVNKQKPEQAFIRDLYS